MNTPKSIIQYLDWLYSTASQKPISERDEVFQWGKRVAITETKKRLTKAVEEIEAIQLADIGNDARNMKALILTILRGEQNTVV